MAEYIIQEETLVGIAEAIRSKTGESDPVAVTDMADKISGIAVDEKVETTVALDFSEGDMQLTPEDGTAFSSVNIPAPATLIPENIAEGVDIAGVIGTLAGGGILTGGTFTGNRGVYTLQHGLGVVPDMIWIMCTSGVTTGRYIRQGFGLSQKVKDKYGWNYGHVNQMGTGSGEYNQGASIDTTSNTQYFHNANENTIMIGKVHATYYANTYPGKYYWFAIGGLT